VPSEMKLWPCKVIPGPGDKPMIVVNFKGEEKQLAAEEISFMVLLKMEDAANNFARGYYTVGKGIMLVKYCWTQWEIPWSLATLVCWCGDRLSVFIYLQKFPLSRMVAQISINREHAVLIALQSSVLLVTRMATGSEAAKPVEVVDTVFKVFNNCKSASFTAESISNHEISSFVIPVHDSASEHQVVNKRTGPEISVLAFPYNAEPMLLSSLASIALGPPTANFNTSIPASCVTVSLGAHHIFDEMTKGSWCLPQLRHQHYRPGNVWKFLHSYSSCIIDYHGTKHNNVFRRALVWCCKFSVHELLGHFEYLLLDITKEHTISCINSGGLERTFILWLSWPTPVKIFHASGELRPRSWPSLYCHQSIVAFGFDESTYTRVCQYYIYLLKSPWPPPLKQNFKYMYAKLSKIMLAMAMSLKCAHTPVVAGQMYIQRSRCMVDCFHRDQISKCWKHQFELAESAFQLNLWFEFELHGTQQKPPWLSIVYSLLFLLKLLCIQLNSPIDTLVKIKDSGSPEIPVPGLSFIWSGKVLITSVLFEWVVLKHLDLLHKNYHMDYIFIFTDYTLNRAATIFGSKRRNEAIFSAIQTQLKNNHLEVQTFSIDLRASRVLRRGECQVC
jgi:hypothetical protein